MTDPVLISIGFADRNAVRVQLGLPPMPDVPRPPPEEKYVTLKGYDNQQHVRETLASSHVMLIGLAIAGLRAPHIARILGCSESSVKKRVRAAGIHQPEGKPRTTFPPFSSAAPR